jgi:dsDNA-specific endonuclease/ATPase MutS2
MERGRAHPVDPKAILSLQPGQKVFVVPFHKPATLIRLNPDRGQATVQAGAFEMDLPLSDLQPIL